MAITWIDARIAPGFRSEMRNGIAMTSSALVRKSTIANPWRAITIGR